MAGLGTLDCGLIVCLGFFRFRLTTDTRPPAMARTQLSQQDVHVQESDSAGHASEIPKSRSSKPSAVNGVLGQKTMPPWEGELLHATALRIAKGREVEYHAGDHLHDLHGLDITVALVQALIPLGFRAAEKALLREVDVLAGPRYARDDGMTHRVR